jgi:hypothetical protein
MTSPTRIDFGNALAAPGIRQPSGTINIDAFGLAQAQLTFAVDMADLDTALAFYSASVEYPDGLSFKLVSYKTHANISKGGVAMITVDYMGVWRSGGITDAQITGVASTSAQPIETHPNFTVVTDDTIGTGIPLGGKPPDNLTTVNDPIFTKVTNVDGRTSYTFNGFGCGQTVNIKAGVRQFLRPMYTVRGVIFFNPENGNKAATMTNNVGRTLNNPNDMQTLITPGDILGALSEELCLLTAANAECIGNVGSYAGIKVTYDIMIGGDIGWDPDIYGKMEEAIF